MRSGAGFAAEEGKAATGSLSASRIQDLVRPVSRTFYLTLRWLPDGVRPAIQLAYLLARATDTIADCDWAGAAERLEILRGFEQAAWRVEAAKIPATHAVGLLAEAELHSLSPGEHELLKNLPGVIASLDTLCSAPQIRTVCSTILRGQIFDLEREVQGISGTALAWTQVLEYCHLVAGCVGEFWTAICGLADPEWSVESQGVLARRGNAYGIALQLFNILRDREKDARSGRIYLRDEDLTLAVETIRSGLHAGDWYCRSIRSRRLRFATALPRKIALQMLPSLLCEGGPRPGRAGILRIVAAEALHSVLAGARRP